MTSKDITASETIAWCRNTLILRWVLKKFPLISLIPTKTNKHIPEMWGAWWTKYSYTAMIHQQPPHLKTHLCVVTSKFSHRQTLTFDIAANYDASSCSVLLLLSLKCKDEEWLGVTEARQERVPELGSRVAECSTPHGAEMVRGNREADGAGGSEATGWSGDVKSSWQVRREAVDGHKCINENAVMSSDQEQESLRYGGGWWWEEEQFCLGCQPQSCGPAKR